MKAMVRGRGGVVRRTRSGRSTPPAYGSGAANPVSRPRTRSSHPWSLDRRHPWRLTVRRNTPPLPPVVASPPFNGRAANFEQTEVLCVVVIDGRAACANVAVSIDVPNADDGALTDPVGRCLAMTNPGGSGGVSRRTRSSHPWSLDRRHPWRLTVRRNTPPLPPVVASPPFNGRAAHFEQTDSLRVGSSIGRHVCRTPPSRWRPERSRSFRIHVERRRFGAPDREAPWMAPIERPGMARACPAHRTAVARPI